MRVMCSSRPSLARPLLLVGALALPLGCGDQIAAVKAVAKLAKQAEKAKEAAQAEKAAGADAGEAGAGSEAGAAQPQLDPQDPAAAIALATKQMQEQGTLRKGPLVNWRQLIGFLPDTLGGFEATAKAKGSTTKVAPVAGAGGTEVRRRYKRGAEQADVTIMDTMVGPGLLATFNVAAGFEEDSSDGYNKGAKIGGQPARVEWKEGSKRSVATVLVGGRFIVTVKVRSAASHDAAAKLAEALDLAAIAAVSPEGE